MVTAMIGGFGVGYFTQEYFSLWIVFALSVVGGCAIGSLSVVLGLP